MILVNLADPLVKLLKEIHDDEVYDNLLTWKVHLVKSLKLPIFFTLDNSNYLLSSININDQTIIYGIWDSVNKKGIICKEVVSSLYNFAIKTVPVMEVTPFNNTIFLTKTDQYSDLQDRAFEILTRLIVSPLHANKSNQELAVKSIQLSLEFRNNLGDLKTLLDTSM